MKIIALPILALSQLAFAGEAELACNLERSKAEVAAATLAAPQAFGSFGQDSTASSVSTVIGLSQSYSGKARADLIRKAADAKCEALQASLKIDETNRWSIALIKRRAATVELVFVDEALVYARDVLAMANKQLEAKTITLATQLEAQSNVAALERQRINLLRIISVQAMPVEPTSIPVLISNAIDAEALAARFAAEAAAEASWDVTVAAGIKQPLRNGKTVPFATLNFRYSFGAAEAAVAARAVEVQTRQLLEEQSAGYVKSIIRTRTELKALIEADDALITAAASQLVDLDRGIAVLRPLTTAAGINALRTLELKRLVLDADLKGAQIRSDGYRQLLKDLT